MSNKRKIVLLYSIIAFLLISFSIHFGFKYIITLDEWAGLIFGVILMIGAIPFYFLGKKAPILYFITFVINIVGVGLSITCYYIFKQYQLEFIDYATAFSISLLVLIGFGLISSTRVHKMHPILYTAFFILASFIISLTLWNSDPGFSGLTFYYLNVSYFFMIGMIAASEDLRELSKMMALISFGAFILVSIIVLFIITEGEAIEGVFEMSGLPVEGKKKKK